MPENPEAVGSVLNEYRNPLDRTDGLDSLPGQAAEGFMELDPDSLVPEAEQLFGARRTLSRREFLKLSAAAGAAVLAACGPEDSPTPTRIPVITPRPPGETPQGTPDAPVPTATIAPTVHPTEIPTPLPGGPDDILVNTGVSPWPTSIEEVPEQFIGGGEYILDVYAPNVQNQYEDVRRFLTSSNFRIVDERPKLASANDVYLVVVENLDPYRWAVAGVTRSGFVVPIDENDVMMDRPDWATVNVSRYEEIRDGYGSEYVRNWELINDHWVPVVRDANGKLLAFYDINKGEFVRAEVIVKTIQEQLDAWTTAELSNESTVETASGTYTFKVAVSSEVAKMGGLIKFTVDDNTQNDAMLYALARLWHWEDKLGGEGRSPDNTFGQIPSIELTDSPQRFIDAMDSITTRPTTDILNHQTTYTIGEALPRQEISGIHVMVVTEEELLQLKTRLQKDGTPYMRATRDTTIGGIMRINPADQEFIVFNDHGNLQIIYFNHINGVGYADYSIGLESPIPNISNSLKYFNRNTFNYSRVVGTLFNYPFNAFEEWKDNHSRSWGGQESLFGIQGNTPPFIFPESTPQLQVEFADN